MKNCTTIIFFVAGVVFSELERQRRSPDNPVFVEGVNSLLSIHSTPCTRLYTFGNCCDELRRAMWKYLGRNDTRVA